jgi:peptide/nickel transport system substrate-binding protein
MVGSGPYRYKADERVPGSRVVYERFIDYVPRPDGTPDGSAGPKRAYFDRVEWRIIPEGGTIAAALQRGEVDWWLIPDADLLAPLKRDKKLTVRITDPTGFIGTLRFNQLLPPFDKVAMRRAVLSAVRQADYMTAIAGTDTSLWKTPCGVFCPGTPMASEVGLAALGSAPDKTALKRAFADAGYQGERIVLLSPTNIAGAKALADITHGWMREVGLNVDYQGMDWATLVQRRAKQDPIDHGGWSLYHTSWSGADHLNPVGHVFLRGNGKQATVGWPDSPAIENLRDAWLAAPDVASQQKIAAQLQAQAMQDVPYIPLGQYFLPAVYQANLTGVLDGNPVFWNVRRA